MRTGRTPLVLQLDHGQWRGEPPHGPLHLQVVGISRSRVRGWLTVSGWRQLADRSKPRLVRVQVRADVIASLMGDRQ